MVSDRLTCESWAVFNCKKVFIHIVDLLWIYCGFVNKS